MTRACRSVAVVLASVPLLAASSGGRVTIEIDGFRSDAGRAYVALHASPAGFPGADGSAARTADTPIAGGRATVALDGIAPGTYAVAVVHDENANGKLDTNVLGIPTEGVGASNGAQGRFSAARFDDAKFTVSADTTIAIAIVYVGFF